MAKFIDRHLNITDQRLELARIPARFRNAKSENPEIAAFEREISANLRSGRSLVLIGPPESGKTVAACAICRSAIGHAAYTLYITAPALIRSLTNGMMWDEDRTMEVVLMDRDLLVIDDLGDESAGSEEKILSLIRHRFNETLATIVSTALTEEQLEKRYGVRFLSLLRRACKFIQMGVNHQPITKKLSYSHRDDDVFGMIGADLFSLSNAALGRRFGPKLRKKYPQLSDEAHRAIFNRIRRKHGLPASQDVK